MSAKFRSLALVLTASLAVSAAAAAPASAAKKPKAPSYVAVANGVAGLASVVRVSAPRYAGQAVTIAASQPGSATVTLPITLNKNGEGVTSWTPSAAGTWAVQGQGAFATATGSRINVAAVPTMTTITVAAQAQANLATDVYATVSAASGSLAPQGTVSFATIYGSQLGSATLTPGAQASSTARISWTPPSVGYYPIVATYTPAIGSGGVANTLGSSGNQTVRVMDVQPTLTIRVPSVLRVGEASLVAGVVNNLNLQGSVAMSSNANGTTTSVMPSTVLQNNVAQTIWTPSVSGNQILTASFTSTNSDATATQTQYVNVLGPRAADAVSAGPVGQQPWPIIADAQIPFPVGGSVPIAVGTQSGAPVTMAISGPCVVIDGTVIATGKSGLCNLVVSTAGTANYAPTDVTYTFVLKNLGKLDRELAE